MIELRERRIAGWADIAEAIGVNQKTARRYASRKKDPLPVYWQRCGGYVVAHATALRDWLERQEIPLQLRETVEDEETRTSDAEA